MEVGSLLQMVADNGTNSPDATETLKTFQWVTEGLLLMLISSIGLIGNSCSVVTCARQRKSPTRQAMPGRIRRAVIVAPADTVQKEGQSSALNTASILDFPKLDQMRTVSFWAIKVPKHPC